jgi:O-antigen/teichoic acid export membrane protein
MKKEKKIIAEVSISWLSRIWISGSQLVAIRLWSEHMGVDGLAAILVLITLQSWLMLADLGIGQYLQNQIVQARTRSERSSEIFRSAINMMIKIFGWASLLWILLAFFLVKILPEKWVYEVGFIWSWIVLISVGILWIFLPLPQLIYRVWFAEGKGWMSFMVSAFSQAVGCIAIFFCASGVGGKNFLINILAWIVPQILFPLYFLGYALWKTPRDRNVSAKSICRGSSGFALFSFAGMAVTQIDFLVVSTIASSSSSLVEYGIIQKLLAAAMSLVSALISMTIPFITLNMEMGEFEKVKKRIRNVIFSGIMVMSFFIVSLISFDKYFIYLFVPRSGVIFSLGLTLILGLYWLLRVWTDVWAGYHLAVSNSRSLIVGIAFQGPITWSMMFLMYPSMGLKGIALAMVCGFLLTVAWWLPFSARVHMNKWSLKHTLFALPVN